MLTDTDNLPIAPAWPLPYMDLLSQFKGVGAEDSHSMDCHLFSLPARIFHESLAATADMVVLPGVLGCRTLRRTVQVRLGSNTLRLPGGTPIFTVSRRQFMKHPG